MTPVISNHPEVLGGQPVFAGTRVPVESLFQHLEADDFIDVFLDGFPDVQRDQVLTLPREAPDRLLSSE